MTRQEYLELRQKDDRLAIMLNHHNEVSGVAALNAEEYRTALEHYIRKNTIDVISYNSFFDNLYDIVILYFDIKYSITYIHVTKEVKTITTSVRILG